VLYTENHVEGKGSLTLVLLTPVSPRDHPTHRTLHRPCGLNAIFLGPVVGSAPDLRQADGGMKPVEYDQRDTQIADDAPRQVPVELRVQWEILGFLHFEDADDPEAEIQQQQESDECASRLELGLCRRVDAAVTGVDDEQRLQCCLSRVHTASHLCLHPYDIHVNIIHHQSNVRIVCTVFRSAVVCLSQFYLPDAVAINSRSQ